jgi:hypothetical protein
LDERNGKTLGWAAGLTLSQMAAREARATYSVAWRKMVAGVRSRERVSLQVNQEIAAEEERPRMAMSQGRVRRSGGVA